MRRVCPVLICASALAAWTAFAAETRPRDEYQSIVIRNPFNLKDPPPPAQPPPQAEPPAAKKTEFYLTGISTIGYPVRPKKAYLLNKDNSKKEYAEKYFNLQVGERSGDLTVKDIDEKGRRVKIAYRGEETWLSMKDNGVPAPSGAQMPSALVPSAPGLPMAPGVQQPGGPVPLPTMNSTAPASQPVIYPNAASNRRNLRGNFGGGVNNANYQNPANNLVNTGTGLPTVNFGGDQNAGIPGQQDQPQQPQPPPLDPVEQALRMGLQKAAADQAGEAMPPLPPVF